MDTPPPQSKSKHHSQPQNQYTNTLTRWYIDTRPLTSNTTALPLLETLQPPDQDAIRRYYHLKDRHMSLASNLLKYLFVHRACRVPWNAIVISRTPEPHRRPCYIPQIDKQHDDTGCENESSRLTPAVEFNVSHQASMVALAGTMTTTATAAASSGTGTEEGSEKPQVGIDITCVNERQNRSVSAGGGGGGGGGRTREALNNYIDIFTEVFSSGEIQAMKRLDGAPMPAGSSGAEDFLAEYGYRLFYTYWALKEAYIKMSGEALLAPWLRELEFSDVVAPAAETGDLFGKPYKRVKTSLGGKAVEDVRIEVVALEGDYLIATAAKGAGIGPRAREGDEDDTWLPFEKLDIERDIRPCATGVCNCLE